MTAVLSVSPHQRRMITFFMIVGSVMVTMDSTIANVALPHMQASFAATQEQVSWILTSYIVATAIFTPLTAFLAGRLGYQLMLTFSFGGFAVASILCANATSVETMVLYRAIQGATGAAVFPLSQAILLDINTQEDYGPAMAMWGVGMMVGPIVGPIVGGYITDLWGWPWIFYINVPIGLAAAFGIARYLPDKELEDTPFDLTGFLLLALAIGSVQLMLDRGQSLDWFESTEIILELTLFFLCAYMFVVHINTKDKPFIEPALFRDRNLCVGLLLSFTVGSTFVPSIALIPLFLQSLADYPAKLAGLILAPRGLGMMVGMFLVGRLIGRIDERILISVGMLISAGILFRMAYFTPDVDIWTVTWTGFVQNLGMGLTFVPTSTLAYSTLAPHFRTAASGLYNLMRNVGTSMGVAMVFTILARGIQENHARLAENVTPFNDALSGPNMPDRFDLDRLPDLYIFDMMVNREATIAAYQTDFLIMGAVTVLVLPFVWLMGHTEAASAGTAPSSSAPSNTTQEATA